MSISENEEHFESSQEASKEVLEMAKTELAMGGMLPPASPLSHSSKLSPKRSQRTGPSGVLGATPKRASAQPSRASPKKKSPSPVRLVKNGKLKPAHCRVFGDKSLMRRDKQCRTCKRMASEDDDVDPTKYLHWAYQKHTQIVNDTEIVSGKVDFYCSKAHEVYHKKLTMKQLCERLDDPVNVDFRDQFQMDRESIVETIRHEGHSDNVPQAKFKKMREEVVRTTISRLVRGKTGQEYEKEKFLELFKSKPEIISKAKFYKVRFKDNGKWCYEWRTKVYDQDKGVYAFREEDEDAVTHTQHLHDDRFSREGDDSAVGAFDDAVVDAHGSWSQATAITATDLGIESKSCAEVKKEPAGPSQPSKRDAPKLQDEDSSSDDDGLTPAQRLMKSREPAPKKRNKGNTGQQPSASGPGSGKAGGATGKDTTVDAKKLLEDYEREMQSLKKCKALSDINDESLSALYARFKTKAGSMQKKVDEASIGELAVVNRSKDQLGCVLEAFKASTTWGSKKTKPNAFKVGTKFEDVKKSGVNLSMLPSCLWSISIYCEVSILCSSQHWKEALGLCTATSIQARLPDATPGDLFDAQDYMAQRVMFDFVRVHGDKKLNADETIAKLKDLLTHCASILRPAVAKIHEHAMSILNYTNQTADTLRDAVDYIDREANAANADKFAKSFVNMYPTEDVFKQAKNSIQKQHAKSTYLELLKSKVAELKNAFGEKLDATHLAGSSGLKDVENATKLVQHVESVVKTCTDDAANVEATKSMIEEFISNEFEKFSLACAALFRNQYGNVSTKLREVPDGTLPDIKASGCCKELIEVSGVIIKGGLLVMLNSIGKMTKKFNLPGTAWTSRRQSIKMFIDATIAVNECLMAIEDLQNFLDAGSLAIHGNPKRMSLALTRIASLCKPVKHVQDIRDLLPGKTYPTAGVLSALGQPSTDITQKVFPWSEHLINEVQAPAVNNFMKEVFVHKHLLAGRESIIYPEDTSKEKDAGLASHPPTDCGELIDMLCLNDDVSTALMVQALAQLEQIQILYATVRVARFDEDEVVESAAKAIALLKVSPPQNVFITQVSKLKIRLKEFGDFVSRVSEWSKDSEKYDFPATVALLEKKMVFEVDAAILRWESGLADAVAKMKKAHPPEWRSKALNGMDEQWIKDTILHRHFLATVGPEHTARSICWTYKCCNYTYNSDKYR